MTVPDIFGKMSKAANKAFGKVAKVGNIQADPDLRLYESLQPQDFDRIVQQYGADDAIKYIQAFEAKRMMKGRNNVNKSG